MSRKRARRSQTVKVRLEPRLLWAVLVPVQDKHGVMFPQRHHDWFFKKVRRISGGITRNPMAQGEWKHKRRLYSEPVVSLMFLATDEEADKVAATGRKHYRQIEVIYYVVSNHVRKVGDN